MDILKYFYEEPVSLEVLSSHDDPDPRRKQGRRLSLEALLDRPAYFRGYLAGTDLDRSRIGLTAIARPSAFVEPLMDWLDAPYWQYVESSGTVRTVDQTEIRTFLLHPDRTALLVNTDQILPEPLLRSATGDERRYTLSGLRSLLDEARVVLIPEPAHHGFDWSLFSRFPLQEDWVEALHRHPSDQVRRFVLPFQKARSEQKFYFEQWQLNAESLPDHIREV